jgi:hypothetical protein
MVLIILAAKYHTIPLCSTRSILFGCVIECNTVNHVSQILTQTHKKTFDILCNLPQTKSDIHPGLSLTNLWLAVMVVICYSLCAHTRSLLALIIRVSTIAVHLMVYIFLLSLPKISRYSSKTLSLFT